jgi:transposase
MDYWFNYVPDEPSEEDFQEIAEDKELFDAVVNCFIRVSRHLKEGINIDGTWYKGQIKIGV